MSKNAGGKKNPLLTGNSERNRKIFIQVGVAAVLIALVAGIGIGIAAKKAKKDDPGPVPTMTMPAANAAPDAIPGSITDKGAIRVGKPDAKVTVRVIGDLQCPACKQFEAANGSLIEEGVKNGTLIAEYDIISFLDKMSTNQYASRANNASYCVAESDPAKYPHWLSTMYQKQTPENGVGLTDDQIIQIAKDAGYTDPAVAQCITDNKYAKYVTSTTKQVFSEGIKGTPTVYINGKVVEDNNAINTPGGLAPLIADAAK